MGFDLDDLLARNDQLRIAGVTTGKKKKPSKQRGTSFDVPLNMPSTEAVTRARAGKMAVKNGAKWEDAVKKECASAQRAGDAVVVKLEPPTRTVRGPGGGTRIIFLEKGGADWIGVAFGVPVAFETKSVHSVNRYSVIKKNENQIVFLRDFQLNCKRMGKPCVVGYYILWRSSGERRFHPINTLSDRSINRKDGILVQSWIDAARELINA